MTSLQIIFTIIIFAIFPINGNVSSCGRRLERQEGLITNGFKSKVGDWPWHAAIYHFEHVDPNYKCGGSLLNSNNILTAAHCVFEQGGLIIPDRLLVRLGVYNLKILGINSQSFQVYTIIPHPSYNISDFSNDIAIVRLSTQAILNNFVQPICLWDPNNVEISAVTNKLGTVTGWGITETDELSFILRDATLPVVTFSTCINSNRDFFGSFLSDKNFCAGYRNGTSVCNGDSGGSMTFEENGIHRIRGIVSLAATRSDNLLCNTKEYVVFTDVAQYLNWIEDMVPELKHSPPKTATDANLNTPLKDVQKSVDWAGYKWLLRDELNNGPDLNWTSNNIWIDSSDFLHMTLRNLPSSGWSCAELYTKAKFGFGMFRWFIEGSIDRFDANVVFRLFTREDVHKTNEISIDIAKWGVTEPEASNLYYFVNPSGNNTVKPVSFGTRTSLEGTYTTHQFIWAVNYVSFQTQHGFYYSPTVNVFSTFQTPRYFASYIPNVKAPLHLSLCAFDNEAPTNGKSVEVIVHDFKYIEAY